MKIELRTLTPLWTGGVEGRSSRVHETGMMGSLRWWYEAIVRGLGGRACDPTEHRCQLDEKRFTRPTSDDRSTWRTALREAGLCDACQAYGATGWAQRFRLQIRGGRPLGFNGALNIKPTGRNRGWYLLPGLIDGLRAVVVPRPHYDPATLIIPLHLAADWGALGARTQHGYGVVEASVVEKKKQGTVDQDMVAGLPSGIENSDDGLPSLRNMFFAKADFTTTSVRWWRDVDGLRHFDRRDEGKIEAWVNSGSVPVAPAIRNCLRFKSDLGISGYGPENFIFGSSRPVCKICYQQSCGHKDGEWERVKTKIHISSAYPTDDEKRNWQIRVWGWIPRDLPGGVSLNRDRILDELHRVLGHKRVWRETLGSGVGLPALEWREFGAPTRDTNTGKLNTPSEFLMALLT